MLRLSRSRAHWGIWIGIGAFLTAIPFAYAQKKQAPRFKITSAKAQQIVLHRYHGKLAGKTTLENEEGIWQYSVMVRTGKVLREVMVDAKTGKIANVEVTTPAKEHAEAYADKARAHTKKPIPKR